MAVTDYTPILGKGRKEYNVGGGTQRWYLVSRAKITAFVRPLVLTDAGATSAADFVVVSEDIEFAGTDGWIPCYATRDTVKAVSDYVTERDSSGFSVKGGLFVPGANYEDIGNLQLAANDDVCVLILMPDGKRLLLGSDMFACEVKYKWTMGENAKGGRGSELEFDSFEVSPMFYTGAITLVS